MIYSPVSNAERVFESPANTARQFSDSCCTRLRLAMHSAVVWIIIIIIIIITCAITNNNNNVNISVDLC